MYFSSLFRFTLFFFTALFCISSTTLANPINVGPFNHPVNGQGSHSGKADHDPRKSPPRFVHEMPCTLNTDHGYIKYTGQDVTLSYQTRDSKVFVGNYQDPSDPSIHVPLTATLYQDGSLSVLGEVDAANRPKALEIELKPFGTNRATMYFPQGLGYWKDIQDLSVCKIKTDLNLQMIGGFEIHQR